MSERSSFPMSTVAFLTLGCKVNQYDTQVMREQFLANGYTEVPFDEAADIYLINTCTVTGTGDKKSMNAIRRCRRMNPQCEIIVAGCLAQRDPAAVQGIPGVRLILGTQHRGEVVSLLEQVIKEERALIAVEAKISRVYENDHVHVNEGHTRAVLKIQEGCTQYCTYCIIPSVRGPVRSRPLSEISEECRHLAEHGYQEIVLTGIHLSSYGRDFGNGTTLMDAIRTVHETEGIERIRLGSLEPRIITENVVRRLEEMPKVCLQFHLALQSGSDPILKAMNRHYTSEEFLHACELLRTAFPYCAITTDVMTGFPGETEERFLETVETCRRAGFSRMHVFPYSERAGTKAAVMEGSVPVSIRQQRAKRLIAVGEELKRLAENRMIGQKETVLIERRENGFYIGYTGTYFRCIIKTDEGEGNLEGHLVPVCITGGDGETLMATITGKW